MSKGTKAGLCAFAVCLKGSGCGYAHTTEEIPRYKRRLCKLFMSGACDRGALCVFAHGADELRL